MTSTSLLLRTLSLSLKSRQNTYKAIHLDGSKTLVLVQAHIPTRMGLFGLFSSKPEAAPDAASRQDRQKCWESRDAYFACLDSAGVLIAGEEGNKCASQNARYEENCARSWVRAVYLRVVRMLTCCHFLVTRPPERSTTSTSAA